MNGLYELSDLTLSNVLERHREALGEAETLRATAMYCLNITMMSPDGPMGITVTRDELTMRERIVTEASSLGQRVVTGFDGRLAWEISPKFDGYHRKTHPETLKAMRRLSTLWQIDVDSGNNGPTPELLGIGTDSRGKACYVVQRQLQNEAGQYVPQQEFLDAGTFLLREQREGEEGEETWLFDDYRSHGGRKWAFLQTLINRHGKFVFRISSVEILALEDLDFTHPNKEAPHEDDSDLHPDLAAFEFICETIEKVHYDPTFGGVDWKAVSDSFRPEVAALDGRGGKRFVELVTRMLARLGVTHYSILPRKQVRTGEARANLPGRLGLELRWVDGAATVYETVEETPASNSPLRPGFIVTAINGKGHDALHRKHANAIGHVVNSDVRRLKPYYLEMRVQAGEAVTIDYLDAVDRHHKVELVAIEKEKMYNARFRSERRDGVLIIGFKLFGGDLVERFTEAINSNRDASGLVIDLRGNPGGFTPTEIASMLSSESGCLGKSVHRHDTTTLSFAGSRDAFADQIAVIIDSLSGSSSEMLAGVLQEMQRARVFGRRSAGGVLPSQEVLLPNGCFFQFVVAEYFTPGGKRLEGIGVVPDGEIELRRSDLIGGHDRDIEAALSWLIAGRG